MTKLATKGMYQSFDRSGRETRSSHYCPGCGHGVVHKIVSEAIVELGIQDECVFVSPIGCAVFGYYYFDCGNIGSAHGRAPCVGTAIARAHQHAKVIVYQGDGDLGAIGFNNCFQAASRGERFATIFVNNAIYGMTGGQMAPTSLLGMKTETSPYGRKENVEGYPLHACEVINQLKAPVYIERVSVSDSRRTAQAKRAIRKALEIQRDGLGYAFVEILSPCPTNMGMDAIKSAAWVNDFLEKEYPLSCLRDQSISRQRPAAIPKAPNLGAAELEAYFLKDAPHFSQAETVKLERELRLKIAGSGGQGVLSLGQVLAQAALASGLSATWFPSYGPEQRGGSASCSVVLSSQAIGSPTVDSPDVLVCMNQPSFDRFFSELKPKGIAILDSAVQVPDALRQDPRIRFFPASELALAHGIAKAANTAMLGGMRKYGALDQIPESSVVEALQYSFSKKPALIEPNVRLFKESAQ